MGDVVSINTPMTPGIKKTVLWLNENGFHTTDSGDGITNVVDGMECAMDVANVTIKVAPEKLIYEAHRLCFLLQDKGITVEPCNAENKPSIQASYDPVDGTAILFLTGVDDKLLLKRG